MPMKTAAYFAENIRPPSLWSDRMSEKIKRRKIRLDDRIFRYMKFCSFEKMIHEQRINFKRPELWNDPYENFFFRHKICIKNDSPIHLNPISDKFYAVCWTANAESEAFWRLYSRNGLCRTIRIESTVGDILTAIHDAMPFDLQPAITDFCSAGKVVYRKPEVINKVLDRIYASLAEFDEKVLLRNKKGESWKNKLMRTLFEKRNAFKYEEEVRFVFDLFVKQTNEFPKFRFTQDKSEFSMPFDCRKYIKGILVDPYATDEKVSEIKELVETYGLNIKVEESSMNRPHPSIVNQSKVTC